MVLHHVSLGTNDLTRAKAFYDPLMAELGLRVIKETERIIAYGLTETVFSIEKPVARKPESATLSAAFFATCCARVWCP